jgi:hypothetical protein
VITYQTFVHEPARRGALGTTNRPLAPHNVVAQFEVRAAAIEAATALRMAHPSLEPSIIDGAPAWLGEDVQAPRSVATLLVHARDDRSIASELAAAPGARLVYRAGAWTNELILPRLA